MSTDNHLALARSESRETRLTCGTCGGPAEGEYSDADGHVCNTCIARDALELIADWDPGSDRFLTRSAGVTVGRVDYAEEGEADGGVLALARFMAGALAPHAEQPPLSPAGWCWQGTVEERGRWAKGGPFATREAARAACIAAFAAGAYLRE
jgi:hypothetical protein